MIHDGTSIETLLEMVNMNSTLWRPSVIEGSYPRESPGVLFSTNAARDPGMQPGDRVTLRHPQRIGLLTYDWVETEVEISGIHPLPLRVQTYMSLCNLLPISCHDLVLALIVIPE